MASADRYKAGNTLHTMYSVRYEIPCASVVVAFGSSALVRVALQLQDTSPLLQPTYQKTRLDLCSTVQTLVQIIGLR